MVLLKIKLIIIIYGSINYLHQRQVYIYINNYYIFQHITYTFDSRKLVEIYIYALYTGYKMKDLLKKKFIKRTKFSNLMTILFILKNNNFCYEITGKVIVIKLYNNLYFVLCYISHEGFFAKKDMYIMQQIYLKIEKRSLKVQVCIIHQIYMFTTFNK